MYMHVHVHVYAGGTASGFYTVEEDVSLSICIYGGNVEIIPFFILQDVYIRLYMLCGVKRPYLHPVML